MCGGLKRSQNLRNLRDMDLIDGQNFLDIYNAMIEIYKGLKRFRRFWKNAMQKVCGSIEADVKSRREIRRMINDLKREFGFGSDY